MLLPRKKSGSSRFYKSPRIGNISKPAGPFIFKVMYHFFGNYCISTNFGISMSEINKALTQILEKVIKPLGFMNSLSFYDQVSWAWTFLYLSWKEKKHENVYNITVLHCCEADKRVGKAIKMIFHCAESILLLFLKK